MKPRMSSLLASAKEFYQVTEHRILYALYQWKRRRPQSFRFMQRLVAVAALGLLLQVLVVRKSRPSRNSLRPKVPGRPRIVITNFGWNHLDASKATAFPRSKRSKTIWEALQSHSWYYNATDWGSYSNMTTKENLKNMRHYVFLDVEVCGGPSPCPFMEQVFSSRLFREYPKSTKLVVLSQCKEEKKQIFKDCPRRIGSNSLWSLITQSDTAHHSDMYDARYDFPLLPASAPPVVLSKDQRAAIQSCKTSRSILLSIISDSKSTLHESIQKLDNGKDVLVRDASDSGSMNDLLTSSRFVGLVQDDASLLSRVVSAGAIPIIFAGDDLVLPFHPKLVDWKDLSVSIPPNKVAKTLQLLKRIRPSDECRMRQNLWATYESYMSSPTAEVRGMLESLEYTWESR